VLKVQSSTLPFRGSVAALENALNALSYQSSENDFGSDTVTFALSDLGCCGAGGVETGFGSIQIAISSVNDAPVIFAPGSIQKTTENSDAFMYQASGLRVDDVDAGQNLISVRLSASNGLVTLPNIPKTGVKFSVGTGIAEPEVEFQGVLSEVNKALQVLVYRSRIGFSGQDSINITVSDGGDPSQGKGGEQQSSKLIEMQISAVNNPPSVSVPQSAVSVDEDQVVFVSGVSVTDPDVSESQTGFLEVTVTASYDAVLPVQEVTTSSTHTFETQTITLLANTTHPSGYFYLSKVIKCPNKLIEIF